MPRLAALAVVVGATVLAYASAPSSTTLLFDARALVAENPVLREWAPAHVWYLLTHDYWQPMATDGLYRPVTMLSFLVDRAVLGHGDRATGYVVENVLLHAMNAALVYLLVWRLGRRASAATAAALLFAVHPITTEAVTNVVGRADLLATAGVLGGLLCWTYGADARGARRVALAAGLGISAILALFSKESGVVLVAAVVLHDLAFPPGDRRRLRGEHLVLAAIVLCYLAARWWVDRTGLPPEDVSPVDNPIVEAPFWRGRLTAVGVLVRALGLVVWPATLSVDYSYRQIPIVAWPPASPGDWVAVAGVVALPTLVWLLVRRRRTAPAVFFFGGLALLALVPSANLVRVIGSIMAERFFYLPLAGLAAALALAADRWAGMPGRRTGLGIVVAVLTLALGARTAVRNRDWRDERTLWAATVRAVPESAKAHKGYAGALFEPDGDRQELARVITHAERAVAIRPDYQPALVDLGSYYLTMGNVVGAEQPAAAARWYEQAAAVLERARALDERDLMRFVEKMRARGHGDDTIPDTADGILYNNLSLAYVKLGRLEDALGAYERMRALAPTNVAVYRDIATIRAALGQPDESAVALWEAVAIDDDAEAKQRLVELYREVPSGGAPIVTQGPAGEVQLHTSHPVVRRHRCRAWRELAALFTRAGLSALATAVGAEAGSCSDDT
jgi:tetratricopeptide (TPR) repeat protein